MGLITSLFMPLYFGIPVVHIEPVLWSFKPSLLHNAIEAEKGTIVWQPNFAFKHLLIADQKQKFNYYLGTLRKIISCSEPCRKSVFEEYLMRFSEDGLRENALQTSYALAENVFAATLSDFQSKADWLSSNGYISSGSSLDHTEIIISEENESEETEDSEIYVSGSCVVDGYVELSSDNFSRTQKGVNRFKTRDKGILVNNSLIVFGRIDDTLIINGKKIYAHELEREIGEISSIKPGRVLATISNSMTNINIYYEGSLEEVDELILRKIIKSKFEVSVENFAQLPPGFLIKTSSGKIARKKSLDKINQS
jgi:acyl-CoA synthetase (AMP-forming)/AMP-acid ligase II